MMPISTDSVKNQILYTPEISVTTGVMKGEATTSTPSSSLKVSSLGKDDFLKLLLAEMKNQDPLNPANNTEFVAQLAQFSSLEQMTKMNGNLETSIMNNSTMIDSITNAMMISYLGKTVEAESSDFMFDGQNPVQLRFTLDQPTAPGELDITDAAGDVVRTIKLGAGNQGDNTIEWDGMTSGGLYADPGGYSFKITAEDVLGGDVTWTPWYTGVVEGITHKDGKSYLYVGGVLVPFDKIQSISSGKSS